MDSIVNNSQIVSISDVASPPSYYVLLFLLTVDTLMNNAVCKYQCSFNSNCTYVFCFTLTMYNAACKFRQCYSSSQSNNLFFVNHEMIVNNEACKTHKQCCIFMYLKKKLTYSLWMNRQCIGSKYQCCYISDSMHLNTPTYSLAPWILL